MWKRTSEKETSFTDLDQAIHTREESIMKEIREAFALLRNYPRAVTFFGSARAKEGEVYYEKARHLSHRISKELGFAVITGAGPGIMEAANRGAYEAGGQSIGMQIILPHEQKLNQFLTTHITFYFLFVRRLALSFASEAYIFFPGGFGTLDELFEIITLIQTHKIRTLPVILFGKDYWMPFDQFIREHLAIKFKMIDDFDRFIYTITDDEFEILSIVKNVSTRKI